MDKEPGLLIVSKRSRNAPNGTRKVSQNGYNYTKTDDGWRLTHHIIAERSLARLVDTSQERVVFIDKDKTNLDPSNIRVVPKKNGKVIRIGKLERQIQILQEELDYLRG